MRPAAPLLVTLTMLAFAGCGANGTPAPSSATVTPVFLPPSTAAQPGTPDAPGPSGTPVPGSPQPTRAEPRVRSVLLDENRIGSMALGSASPAELANLLDQRLGKGRKVADRTCDGRATAVSWGALAVTFSGRPQVARYWQVDTAKGTSGLRLPRSAEWRPYLTALTEHDGADVATGGGSTTVTLPEGLTYVVPKGEQRARYVRAGTLSCG